MLRHYVFLRYRGGTPPEHITVFCERMLALPSSIGEIRHLEIGRDELHDARSWDVILIMAFDGVEALRAYQRHPAHQALMAFNDPFVADVASIDFMRDDE
ncbi:MAG TPA: Dabb family protein [Gammaproteobacteria bacterium]|nr:Dabb family protein [Gammaproteobacteria bacterium]